MADTYTVLSQEQRIGKLPDNTFGPVVAIKFRTAANIVREVDVPLSEYTPEQVAARLEAESANTDQISNL